MHKWSSVDSKNEFEPYAEYSLHTTIPAGKLSMVLMLTTTFFVLGCWCVCLLSAWRTFVFGRGLIIPQELKRSCDCKMNWNLPGGHNVSSNTRCLIISSGQSHVGCCNRGWASQRALSWSFPLVRHFILWGLSISTSTHCKAAGPKGSAGRTSLHLLPFCLEDLLSVVLRYLDVFEESWVDFSQGMPKGIVGKQAGLSLFYNRGKTFPSIVHTTWWLPKLNSRELGEQVWSRQWLF